MPFTTKKLKGIDTSSLEALGNSVVDLAKFTEDEFGQVATAMQDTEPDTIWRRVPPKPRRGTYAYADGTNWNPGAGEGPYFFNGTVWTPLGITAASLRPVLAPFLRGYISGFNMNSPGSTGVVNITAGECTDSTNTDIMTLSSTFNKSTAAWAAGSGVGAWDGQGTSPATATNAWYAWFAIKNPTTGAVDILCSPSFTAPTLPSGYTLFRRIGAVKTSGTATWWLGFNSYGDYFYWLSVQVDVNNVNYGNTSANAVRPSVPPISCEAFGVIIYANTGIAGNFLSVYPSVNTAHAALCLANVAGITNSVPFRARTEPTGTLYLVNSTATGNQDYMYTSGWMDDRGKNA